MFNKITLGPITIYMYGLMIAMGFIQKVGDHVIAIVKP